MLLASEGDFFCLAARCLIRAALIAFLLSLSISLRRSFARRFLSARRSSSMLSANDRAERKRRARSVSVDPGYLRNNDQIYLTDGRIFMRKTESLINLLSFNLAKNLHKIWQKFNTFWAEYFRLGSLESFTKNKLVFK